jgi:putative glutamine amidotransferase
MKAIVIGVTDCSKFDVYNNWILAASPMVKTIKISWKDDSLNKISQCNGIFLTGGEDVHPRFYGLPEYHDLCNQNDISESRDELELKVLEYSQSQNLPLLGICRGLQIANVFFGGTLIPDIPTWGKFNHSKLQDNSDRYHSVNIDPSSALFQTIKEAKGLINSNHHQSVDKVGKGLVVSALSEDGVVEALDRLNPESGSYLSLVQWHPERLLNQDSPFAKKIREAFIEACLKQK